MPREKESVLYAGKEGDSCEENSFIIIPDTIGCFESRLQPKTNFDQYNNIVQSAGSIALTGNSSPYKVRKEKGIDDYTGNYTANYEDFSDTEYLFEELP